MWGLVGVLTCLFVFCGCCRISKVNDDQSPTTYDLKFMDGDWEENALAENLIVC